MSAIRFLATVVAFAAVTALCLPAKALSKEAANVADTEGNQLCQRVHQFSTAWTHADFRTMDRLLAPGYVHTDDRGAYQPRSTWLKVMHERSANLKALKISMHDIRIRMLGRTAIVTGEDVIDSTHHTGAPPEHLRFTQVWVDNPSGWQRLAFQATPVLNNIKFSHMECAKSNPRICTGRVKVTLPAGKAAVNSSDHGECTFLPASSPGTGKKSD